MKRLVFVCAAAVMAASATTVSTSPALAADYVEIDTSAYNLRSQSGQAALSGRIERAGSEVCGNPAREIKANRAFFACRDAAVADGMAQLSALTRGGAVRVGAR